MNIRSILYLSSFFTLCVTLLLVVLSFNFSASIKERIENANLAAELAQDSTEMALLAEEYVAYRLERMEQQWASKIDSVYALFMRLGESEFKPKLGRDIASLGDAFDQFKQTSTKLARSRDSGNDELSARLSMLEQRRITRLRLLYSEISRLAFQMSVQSRNEANELQGRNNIIITAYAILLTLFLGVSALLLTRTIGGKLALLRARAIAIGQGDLDTEVPDLGKDEIGTLGRTLNNMTRRLRDMAQIERDNSALIYQSEKRFRDFAETAADYFWEIDAHLHFVRVEGSFQSIMGMPAQQIIGQSSVEFWGSSNADASQVQDLMANLDAQQPFENLAFSWTVSEGVARTISFSGKPGFDVDGVFIGYRGSGRDITETQNLARMLSYQATHDSLTELINRREFEQRLQRLMESAQQEQADHVLCYMDLDQFKVINDTCGHLAGDELLRQLVLELSGQLRGRDTLARLGGDEFGILMEHCPMEYGLAKAKKMCRVVDDFRFVWEQRIFNVGVSVGLVTIDQGSNDLKSCMSSADAACYAAKEQGGNRVVVFQQDDSALALRHGEMQWVERINRALDEDRFMLYFQRIVRADGKSDPAPHFELLLRMQDEAGQPVPPGAFLPAAERFNLSVRIDRWVINRAIDWLVAHPRFLQSLELCTINLSGQSIGDADFRVFVNNKLRDSKLPGHKLCFEITETAAIRNLNSALDLIQSLKHKGCKFSLDDFGSGLSSFTYLKNLPVDFLKIDGSFIVDLLDDPIDLAVVKSINEIGQIMGKKTIAEFVESQALAEKLRELGIDYLQGYHFGQPLPLDDLLTDSGLEDDADLAL